jgi:hypothetical protein
MIGAGVVTGSILGRFSCVALLCVFAGCNRNPQSQDSRPSAVREPKEHSAWIRNALHFVKGEQESLYPECPQFAVPWGQALVAERRLALPYARFIESSPVATFSMAGPLMNGVLNLSVTGINPVRETKYVHIVAIGPDSRRIWIKYRIKEELSLTGGYFFGYDILLRSVTWSDFKDEVDLGDQTEVSVEKIEPTSVPWCFSDNVVFSVAIEDGMGQLSSFIQPCPLDLSKYVDDDQ